MVGPSWPKKGLSFGCIGRAIPPVALRASFSALRAAQNTVEDHTAISPVPFRPVARKSCPSGPAGARCFADSLPSPIPRNRFLKRCGNGAHPSPGVRKLR